MPLKKINWKQVTHASIVLAVVGLSLLFFLLSNMICLKGHKSLKALLLTKSAFHGIGCGLIFGGSILCISFILYYYTNVLELLKLHKQTETSWPVVICILIIAFGIWSGRTKHTELVHQYVPKNITIQPR